MVILIASQHTQKFNVELAIQAALLHDILKDTPTTYVELKLNFVKQVADAISAFTKNFQLPKETQMADSLYRISSLPHEVWAVKLADTYFFKVLKIKKYIIFLVLNLILQSLITTSVLNGPIMMF